MLISSITHIETTYTHTQKKKKIPVLQNGIPFFLYVALAGSVTGTCVCTEMCKFHSIWMLPSGVASSAFQDLTTR